jgi:putative ABC transport system permease protein
LPVQPERLTAKEEISSFYRQLIERIQAVPGVISASVATGIPLQGAFGVPFSIVGKPVDNPSQRPGARFNMVSAEYFETFGMRITRGRAFTEQDGAGSVPVAIVNETLAKRYFAHADPLTQRLVVEQRVPGATKPGPGIEWQIVGVSADVRSAGPKNDVRPEIHVPFWQLPWPSARMAIRTAGDPMSVQQSIAAVIRSMDPDLPMANVRTMEQIVDLSFVSDRFNTALFGSFAAVALLLAAFGIYGVMSFAVAQRTHEIGLRIALGAGRSRVLWQVLREGMTTALLGTVLGSAGAYFVVRAMHGMVFGVALLAPTAFIIVAVALLGAALLACLVPAARAASVDPMVALRQE